MCPCEGVDLVTTKTNHYSLEVEPSYDVESGLASTAPGSGDHITKETTGYSYLFMFFSLIN